MNRIDFLKGLLLGGVGIVTSTKTLANLNSNEELEIKNWVLEREKLLKKEEFETEQYWLFNDYCADKQNNVIPIINKINNLFENRIKLKNNNESLKDILNLKKYHTWYKTEYDKKIIPNFITSNNLDLFQHDLQITKYNASEALYKLNIIVGNLDEAEKWFVQFYKDFNTITRDSIIHWELFGDALFVYQYYNESVRYYVKANYNKRWFAKWIKDKNITPEIIEAQRKSCYPLLKSHFDLEFEFKFSDWESKFSKAI